MSNTTLTFPETQMVRIVRGDVVSSTKRKEGWGFDGSERGEAGD
jgi:hypothetical protein